MDLEVMYARGLATGVGASRPLPRAPQGSLTEPIAVTQPRRQEPLFMPLSPYAVVQRSRGRRAVDGIQPLPFARRRRYRAEAVLASD